jgi:hypothetical protein
LRLKTIAYIMLMAVLGLASSAAAQLPGMQLIVTPPTVSFPKITGGDIPVVAAQPLTIQVVISGERPWRLMVMAQGPLQSGEGAEIPSQQVSWKAGPAPVFISGTLSPNQPQLVARGQGSKAGVMNFFLRNRWEYAKGNYSLRLHFTLSSP